MNSRSKYIIQLFLFITAFLIAACESHFDPLQNDRYAFSMYGTLDLHADTQWVRVMPIGEKLVPDDTEPNNIQVKLTRISNGESVVMNDSLFRFGGDGYVWNYWTSFSLNPNEQYKIEAENSEGKKSSSVITTPSVLPVPEIDYTVGTEDGIISGIIMDSLLVLETRYLVQVFGCTPEREVTISHLEQVEQKPGGDYHITINNRIPLIREVGATSFYIRSRKLVIITASKDWLDFSVLSDEEITLPDIVSNVENGTGYLAGIARRDVQITPRQPPCEGR